MKAIEKTFLELLNDPEINKEAKFAAASFIYIMRPEDNKPNQITIGILGDDSERHATTYEVPTDIYRKALQAMGEIILGVALAGIAVKKDDQQ